MGFFGKTVEFVGKSAGCLANGVAHVSSEIAAGVAEMNGKHETADKIRRTGCTIGNTLESGCGKAGELTGKVVDGVIDVGTQFGGQVGKSIAAQKGSNIGKGEMIGQVVGGTIAGTAIGLVATTATVGILAAKGIAGTGAAISGLAGAAKTSAVMAAIGGGSLATGGGGVAAGTAIVVGSNLASGAIGASEGFKKAKKYREARNSQDDIIAITSEK